MESAKNICAKKNVAILFTLSLLIWSVNLAPVLGFQGNRQSVVDFKQFKGKIIDGASKKPLIFATLAVAGTNISTVTNTEGKFLLKIPKNMVDGSVIVSFLGYKSKTIALFDLKANKK